MQHRTPEMTAFVDIEDRLFGWNAEQSTARAKGFVREALGPRRARIRFKTDRYPTVPLGPDTLASTPG